MNQFPKQKRKINLILIAFHLFTFKRTKEFRSTYKCLYVRFLPLAPIWLIYYIAVNYSIVQSAGFVLTPVKEWVWGEVMASNGAAKEGK